MKYKYLYKADKLGPTPGRAGRYVDPSKRMFGDDMMRREKYYAWLKHRAQRNFRKEEYNLTWEDWETLWPDDLFLKRGRGRDDLCLYKLDLQGSWELGNVEVGTRMEYLVRAREYKKK